MLVDYRNPCGPRVRAFLTAFALMLPLAEPAAAQPAVPQQPAAGQRLYEQRCAVCHASALAKAPKVGDARRWAALTREKPAVVIAHGWVGYGGMPAQGGAADATLAEFAAAVVYMARASGQPWTAPDAAALQRIEREVALRRTQLERRAAAQALAQGASR